MNSKVKQKEKHTLMIKKKNLPKNSHYTEEISTGPKTFKIYKLSLGFYE